MAGGLLAPATQLAVKISAVVATSKYQLAHATFDVVSNRVLYSREPLERFWNSTVEHIKGRKIWKIDPEKLISNLIKDFFLTASFVFTFRAGSRAE